MKYRSILFAFLVIGLINCNNPVPNDQEKSTVKPPVKTKTDSQKKINLVLKQKIESADTILLVSHTGDNFDTVKRNSISPELLINNRINRKIIHEQRVITGAGIDTLIGVLTMPTDSVDIQYYHCFDPHHTIFIIQKSKISYIDMCFHCWGLTTSEDLKEIEGYDEPKWKQIYLLFKQWGFKYEMP